MKNLIIIITLTILLISCGGGSNNSSDNTKTILEGNWLILCYIKNQNDINSLYATHEVSFIKNKFISTSKTYNDSSCTTRMTLESDRIISGSFSIGKETTTSSGLLAFEIDVHNELVNGKTVDNYAYSIFRIEQNIVFFGKLNGNNDGTSPILRHDTLKLTRYHEKQ